MKKLPLGAWFALVILVCAGLVWWLHGRISNPAQVAQISPAVTRSAPNSPVITHIIPRVAASTITPSLWQEYAQARQKALQQNPELAAEYKELQADMQVQMKKLETVIVRTDPKTAPIIAKVHAMRERRMAMDAPASNPPVSPGNLSK